jgi:hypothetical protein
MGRHRSLKWSGMLTMLALVFCVSADATQTSRKHVFIKDTDCDGPLSSIVLTSLKQQIKASTKYQLADSLEDTGGLGVVIAVYVTCTDAVLRNSEQIASLATIFGFATCNAGRCHVATDEGSLGVFLCSGKSGVGSGSDIYGALSEYMSTDGDLIFNSLSEEHATTDRHR